MAEMFCQRMRHCPLAIADCRLASLLWANCHPKLADQHYQDPTGYRMVALTSFRFQSIGNCQLAIANPLAVL